MTDPQNPRDTVTKLPTPYSIQGEQQAPTAPVRMDQADVDEQVAKMTDAVAACRERGRHQYPAVRMSGLTFVDYLEDEGLFVQEADCECCGPLAYQRTLWEVRGRGARARYVPIASGTRYRSIVDKDGQIIRYLAPEGMGRMSPRQVREAVATQALRGQSLRTVRKQAIDAGRERRAAAEAEPAAAATPEQPPASPSSASA